jgi:hypothetical protein
MNRTITFIAVAISLFAAASGCNQSKPVNSTVENSSPAPEAPHSRRGGMPHGGTPVQVGPHDYHLELVNDPTEGRMTAFVLDDHGEKPEMVAPTTFELVARINGAENRLTFRPMTNAAGTNVSAFTAIAEWLKSATNFEGVIPRITLGNETFENITFSYPQGKKHSH